MGSYMCYKILSAVKLWVQVLLDLSKGRLTPSFGRLFMKRYVAVCFLCCGINNSWTYIVSHGAPYKECCALEWRCVDPHCMSFSLVCFVAGSEGGKSTSKETTYASNLLRAMSVTSQRTR